MMNIKFIIITFLFSLSSIAQFTNIPDPMFEKILIDQGIDSGAPDQKVLTANISKIKSLIISNESDITNRINDLSGIEDFVSLEILDCKFNNLFTLDLSKNSKLLNLDCSQNNLISINISSNNNLIFLNCSYNSLTDMDLSKNSSLDTLNCSFNKFVTLNLDTNINLKKLNISYNLFTSIALDKNSLLETLHCTFNKLNNLDVSKNTNLTELTCNYNNLKELDLSKNSKLIYLSCTNNSLVNLNLKNGNNINLRYNSTMFPNSNFNNNVNLFCIAVDDVNYSNTYWQALKESTTIYTNIYSPSPIIPSPQTFCSSESPTIADIVVSSDSGLSWYFFPVFGSKLPSNTPLINGRTYYASQNSGSCNSARIGVKIDITNNDKPKLNIEILPDIIGNCNIEIKTIPTAIDTCLGLITATTTSPLKYNKPGDYIITWNYNLGKLNAISQNQKVKIQAEPQPIAAATQVFCAGKNQTIKNINVAGTNIKWYNTEVSTNSLSTETLLVNGSKYFASQTIAGCESSRISVNITVEDNQKPIPTLANLPDIIGDCKTVITTIPTAIDNCAGLILATTSSSLIFNSEGNYTILWHFNDGNENKVTQEQKVFIKAVALPLITPPELFCFQKKAKLMDITISGQNIKWYDKENNSLSLDHILQNNTTYFATQTIDKCESKKVLFEAKILSTHPVKGETKQNFCSDINAKIENINVIGNDIKWYDFNMLPIPTNRPLINGASYFATQTVNGCESPTKLQITTNIIEALITNDFEDNLCDDLQETFKIINLEEYNNRITTINAGYNFSYYNSRAGAENELEKNLIKDYTNHSVFLGMNKIYVRISSNSVCSAIVELKIELFALPKIDIASEMPICEKTPITISAGLNHDIYNWSNGESTPNITTNIIGDYWLEVGKNHNFRSCYNKANFKLIASSKANIINIETAEWTDNKNAITINTTGTGNYLYSIDGYSFQESNQFTDIINGQKIIFVKDLNGCKTTNKEVFILMYPRFFTPNGDGINDTWEIKYLDFEKERTIEIFNRNGQLVKKLTNSTENWDGKFNGQDLPADDYWFITKGINEKEIKSHFSLKR